MGNQKLYRAIQTNKNESKEIFTRLDLQRNKQQQQEWIQNENNNVSSKGYYQ